MWRREERADATGAHGKSQGGFSRWLFRPQLGGGDVEEGGGRGGAAGEAAAVGRCTLLLVDALLLLVDALLLTTTMLMLAIAAWCCGCNCWCCCVAAEPATKIPTKKMYVNVFLPACDLLRQLATCSCDLRFFATRWRILRHVICRWRHVIHRMRHVIHRMRHVSKNCDFLRRVHSRWFNLRHKISKLRHVL